MTALEHFEKLLEFETDCWDVHEDLKSGKPEPDFGIAPNV